MSKARSSRKDAILCPSPVFTLFFQVGLFRKSGVKSRIQSLRQMNEASGADGAVSYEGQSAYDVADMLKQYFRDLPEPLLSSKLSETFLQIYQCKNTHLLPAHTPKKTNQTSAGNSRGTGGHVLCIVVVAVTPGSCDTCAHV